MQTKNNRSAPWPEVRDQACNHRIAAAGHVPHDRQDHQFDRRAGEGGGDLTAEPARHTEPGRSRRRRRAGRDVFEQSLHHRIAEGGEPHHP